MIDLRSPYYLHPLDAPGAIITAIHFDGKNFDMWENVVINALRAKNKTAFIDGTITKSDMKKGRNLAQLRAWIIINSMITSWILNGIDLRLHTSIAYANSAKQFGRISVRDIRFLMFQRFTS